MNQSPSVHVFDLESIPWESPAPRPGSDTGVHRQGVEERWLLKPRQDDPDDDRFPVSIIRFQPRFVFPRHWHTDGEFVCVLRGSMMVGGAELGVGGLGYNDARTIYGAEAAGDDGVDFLMIRRAWAKNNLVLGDDAVEGAISNGITDSRDRVVTMAERGLHIFNQDEFPWRDVVSRSETKARRKTLMTPSDGPHADDRFPVTIVQLPVDCDLPDHANSEGQFIFVLDGEIILSGRQVPSSTMAYIDAGAVHSVSSGPDGGTFVSVSRAEGETVYPSESGGDRK